MTISYISAAGAASNSVTLGTHATNDLITIVAFNNTSSTIPSLPTGWINQYTLSATIGWRVGFRIATSSSETSGTWTNADAVIALVHRAGSNALVLPAANVSSSGTATNITYGAIGSALDRTNAPDRWMIALGSTRTADSSIETAPTSFTNRTSVLGGSWELVAHDSNGTLGSYGGSTVSAGGTSALFRTLLIQLFEVAYTAAGGGAARPVSPFRQMVIG
jgi:hypothetical protein